jgi:hypothetical protein
MLKKRQSKLGILWSQQPPHLTSWPPVSCIVQITGVDNCRNIQNGWASNNMP